MSKNKVTVLIVDDDEDITTIMKLLLEEKVDGICVCSAETVEEAEVSVQECDPDIILMDGHMPRGNTKLQDTVALVLWIRESGDKSFMVSISGDYELAIELVKAGCDVKTEKGLLAVDVVVEYLAA